jgi:4-hydroxy-4-methyl-2-oxoglutarate aldolase
MAAQRRWHDPPEDDNQEMTMSEITEELLRLGVPTLYEAAGRRGLVAGVELLVGGPFAGQAHTAEIPGGDNLGLHHGLMATKRTGDIYCLASGGKGRYGVIGELLLEQLRTAKWRAIVIDDAIRDIEILEGPPSVAALGICSRGTIKRRAGRGSVDISLGGILVRPGDWVVGDRNGVVVIPEDRVHVVIAAANARFEKETLIGELVKTPGVTVLEANRIATEELAQPS